MEPYAPFASSRAAMRHDATNGATALWAIFLHLTARHAPPAYVSHGHRSNITRLWRHRADGADSFRWRLDGAKLTS